MKRKVITMIVGLLVGGAVTNAQSPSFDEALLRDAAAYMAGTNSKPLNRQKGFQLHRQVAAKGNAVAMNALGVDYSQGLGTAPNLAEALHWYKKAAEKGYTAAWYNLGKMYLGGHGTEQDLKTAFDCFKKATTGGDVDAKKAMAYMLYKGLGCQQDYSKAYQIYYSSAQEGNSNSMYFIGLCLRNGYGVAKDIDQARYWLQKSAAKGEQQAKDELSLVNPENYLAQKLEPTTLQALGSGNSKYHRIQHNATSADMDGTFSGWAIKYDWSGQFIISRNKLQLDMHRNEDGKITGTWIEKADDISTPIDANLTDSALVFNNTSFSRKDHYSGGKDMVWEFRNAAMQVIRNKDSIYLLGNLQLYSPLRKEPGKPFYVQLAKVANNSPEKIPDAHAMILQAWPNPFPASTINIAFALGQEAPVSISVLGVDGRIVYNENPETLLPGRYTRNVNLNVMPGSYILRLNYGVRVITATIIKQ